MPATVGVDSLITLHYCMTLSDGLCYLNTYATFPAVVQLGVGEFNENLEVCLIGLEEGQEKCFLITAENGFGIHNPALVYAFSGAIREKLGPIREGQRVRFESPDASHLNAVVLTITEDHVLLDFNHPLAGKSFSFTVKIISIL